MLKVIETLLLNLKIIGKIPENGRLRRSDQGTLAIDNSFGIFRFMNGDTRKKAINDINEIISFGIEKCNDIINSKYFDEYYKSEQVTKRIDNEYTKNYELLIIIYTELKNCLQGLSNLKITYEDDSTVLSRIDIIISKIENFTIELEKNILH